MSVNGASTIFGFASEQMEALRYNIKRYSNYQPPFEARMVETTSLLCPKNERQWSVNDVCLCIIPHA
jgi:hypothetical protein